MKEKKIQCKHCQAINQHYSFQCSLIRKPIVNKIETMSWEEYQKKKGNKKPSNPTKSYSIPKISKKQLSRLKGYGELRKEYMNSHKVCEAQIQGCTGRSESIHHLKGRDGDNLFKHFMAICNHCHEKIERMGSEVYELGFKIKRTED